MYSKRLTHSATGSFSEQISRLKRAFDRADAVLLGAGAGLSTAAGFSYDGERFRKHFGDFEAQYGFHDMYSGGFYPYAGPEEYWAFWSRNIFLNRYADPAGPLYRLLWETLRRKDYFVLTTNVDHCFQKAGFDKKRLFYTQGDYGLFQCSEPCCQQTWDNEAAVRQMVERQENLRIPGELVPRCPRCGKPMTPNLRVDERFVQDEGWYAAAARYEDFVRRHRNTGMLYLEIGVGYNTPGIIKFNFWRQVGEDPSAVYACVNRAPAPVPDGIAERSILVPGGAVEAIAGLS